MMKSSRNRRHNNLLAIILIVALMAAQLTGLFAPLRISPAPMTPAVMIESVTPCQQSKSAQNHSGRLCQDIAKLSAIKTNSTAFSFTLTGKLFFLFIAAILTLGFRQRLFKPPKSFYAI